MDELVRVTLKIEISLTTGAEIVVMRRRMDEIKRRRVPIWWMIPVTAILSCLSIELRLVDVDIKWSVNKSWRPICILC